MVTIVYIFQRIHVLCLTSDSWASTHEKHPLTCLVVWVLQRQLFFHSKIGILYFLSVLWGFFCYSDYRLIKSLIFLSASFYLNCLSYYFPIFCHIIFPLIFITSSSYVSCLVDLSPVADCGGSNN